MGLVLTLAIFVCVFLTFLIAPLVALALAYLGYTVMRSRRTGARPASTDPADPAAERPASSSGFGAGAR
ncbi:MAG: hypothetical protein ACXVWZ_00990 [Nocardioides sp.]